MKNKILQLIDECQRKGYDDMKFKEDREYLANTLVESGLFKSDEMNLLDLFKFTEESGLTFLFDTVSGFYRCDILDGKRIISREFTKETPIEVMKLTIKDAVETLKGVFPEEVKDDSRTDEIAD